MKMKTKLLLFLFLLSIYANAQVSNNLITDKSAISNLNLLADNNTNYSNSIYNDQSFDLHKYLNTYKFESNLSQTPPQDPANRLRYGVKLTQHFNYPIMHTSPTSSVYIKNHNFYFGPEFTFLLTKGSSDSTDDWTPELLGLNVGYRCLIKTDMKKANFFVQMNFSFYRVKYKEYASGSLVAIEKDKMIIENTGGAGLNYRFNKKIEIFGGVGFGSTSGFFLLLRHFVPHSFIGVGYKIN